MFKEIKQKIHKAALKRNKIAMFHYQVLLNSNKLQNIDAVVFCNAVEVPESYATEYKKMLKLSLLMQESGFKIK